METTIWARTRKGRHAELHFAAVALDHVGPGQSDEFGDAKATGVANLDKDVIAP